MPRRCTGVIRDAASTFEELGQWCAGGASARNQRRPKEPTRCVSLDVISAASSRSTPSGVLLTLGEEDRLGNGVFHRVRGSPTRVAHRLSTVASELDRLERAAESGSYRRRTWTEPGRRGSGKDPGARYPVSNWSRGSAAAARAECIQEVSAIGATKALASIRRVPGETRKTAVSVPAAAHTHS
jgi:hypothetical protein